MIFTNFKDIGPNVALLRTTIKNPASGPAVRAFGGPKVNANVTVRVEGTTMSGVHREFNIGSNAAVSSGGNRLVARSAPEFRY